MEQAEVTRREREVMRLVAGGRTTAEIARGLGITANTVESHVRSVRTKLGVPTRTAAVAWLPAPAADASRPPHPARPLVLGLVAAGGVAIDAVVVARVAPAGGVAKDPVGVGGGPAPRAATAGPWAAVGGRAEPAGGGADGGEGDGPPSVGLDPVGAALLAALARGLPVTSAAREGHMSLRTAHRRLRDVRQALGAATTAEAVARWCAADRAVAGRAGGSHPWRVGA